jgi:type IV fimbrial biogenesis protein FimT
MLLSRGFSLLEGLVCVTVLALLLGMSLPNWADFLDQRKGELALQKIISSIALARSAAIKSGETVTMCPSKDTSSCGGQWQSGHIVFSDLNRNQLLDEEEILWTSVEHFNLTGTIHFRAFQNRQLLHFNALGFSQYQNGNFTFCSLDRNSQKARQLVLNASGRVRKSVDSDGDGIHEDSAGKPLSCS